MRALDDHDLFMVRRKLPKVLVTVLQEESVQAYIAGGFVRAVIAHEEPSDIDMFVPNKDMAELITSLLLGENRDLYRVDTDNAITLYDHGHLHKIPIQIITRWFYEDPHKLVESFDFSVCQAAVWWNHPAGGGSLELKGEWNSRASDRFYVDLAAKRLTYTAPDRNEDAGGSILRVLKYYRRGYTIPLTDLGRVIARLMRGVDPNRVNMEDEAEVGRVIRGLLREVDPLIDPDHIIQDQHHDGPTDLRAIASPAQDDQGAT